MINAGVLGSPITHSLSPRIHKKAMEILGIEGKYQAFEVTQELFPHFLSDHASADWNGFSLTMPLKESAFGLVAEIEEDALRINSVNTIYRVDGKWHGTSTDLLAFNNLAVVSESSKVAIIGAGGTARAAIGSLDNRVSSVDVLLRNPMREAGMSKAAPNTRINFLDMGADVSGYDLVIQTTPVGAYDEFASKISKPDGLLIEALYKPWPTPIAQKYTAAGALVISGRELLVEQALFQIELFTELRIDFKEMRAALLAEISES